MLMTPSCYGAVRAFLQELRALGLGDVAVDAAARANDADGRFPVRGVPMKIRVKPRREIVPELRARLHAVDADALALRRSHHVEKPRPACPAMQNANGEVRSAARSGPSHT